MVQNGMAEGENEKVGEGIEKQTPFRKLQGDLVFLLFPIFSFPHRNWKVGFGFQFFFFETSFLFSFRYWYRVFLVREYFTNANSKITEGKLSHRQFNAECCLFTHRLLDGPLPLNLKKSFFFFTTTVYFVFTMELNSELAIWLI